MSVYSLKPNFTDREGYLKWRATWKATYLHVSQLIRHRRHELKASQRNWADTAKAQKAFHYLRRDAAKMMTLLGEAKALRDRILAMHQSMHDQEAACPITVEAPVVDFSYNRIHNQFEFMPRWLIRVKGKTYYVEHFDSQIGFSTREMTDPNTKGMLRFRNARMVINSDGTAVITERKKVSLAA